MSTLGAPVVIDDDALRELAEGRELPLFPLLRRAEAMVPLVVVLAFLPALYAVEYRTLSETGARAGLVSLRCLAAGNLSKFVDPAGIDSANDDDFQPPLMTWLTALGMFAFGAASAAGAIAPAYLSTAALVIAGYVLARRLGGEPLGLVSAALLAFNPCVLAGAQEPLPQSPAAMLAMLSLAGLIAHWQKSATVTSYQLLLGGIALGGCLLAGGPVALAVVVSIVLYILWWKLDARFRRHSGLVWDRIEFHRRTAFRSAGVLLATGFAVGGWYILLMSSRHGRLFWQGWINTGATGSATSGSASAPFSFFECVRELNQLALPLLGLAFLGFIGIVRDWYRGDEDSLRHYRGILPVWTAVAFVAWILSGAAGRSGRSDAALWYTMLIIPLVIAAAVGLIEVIERRVGFLAALAVGLLTLADAAILTGQSLADSGESLMNWLPGLSAKVRGVGILMVLGVCGIALFRFAARHEVRRRIVLTGLLLVVVTVNAVWGALAVRRTNQGDSELDAMRTAAARLSRVAHCTFVSLAPRDGQTALLPPAQLTFLLASLWPGAEIRYTNFWDDAVSKPAGGSPPDEAPLEVFAAWSPRGRVRGTPPSAGLRSSAPPFHFRDVEMVLYVRDLGSRGAGE
jgi:hypothetical protein